MSDVDPSLPRLIQQLQNEFKSSVASFPTLAHPTSLGKFRRVDKVPSVRSVHTNPCVWGMLDDISCRAGRFSRFWVAQHEEAMLLVPNHF